MRIWSRPDFVRFFAAHLISAIGSRVTRDGLPLAFILMLGASPAELAALAALAHGPGLVMGLLAGGAVDRRRRRSALIAADLARAAALLLVPIAYALDALAPWQVYVTAAVVGVFDVLFDMANNAYLPTLLPPEALARGNAALEGGEAVAEVTGPSLAGALIQLIGAPLALLVDAGSYLVSAVVLARIRATEAPPVIDGARPAFGRDVREGAAALWRQTTVRAISGASAASALFGGFLATLYYINAVEHVGLSAAAIGVTISAGGIGALIGAAIAAPLRRRLGAGPVMAAGYSVQAATVFGIAASGLMSETAGWITLVATQIVGDAALVVALVHGRTLVQVLLPNSVLGRATGAMHVLAGALVIVGAAVAGILGEVIGVTSTLFVAAAGMLLAPAAIFASRTTMGLRTIPTIDGNTL